MENQVQIFKNEEFGEVRTLSIENNPYFVANDMAKALGYTNPSKATNDHCKNMIFRWGNDSLGRKQQFKLIPESDMYRLIIKSKLPQAEKFEKWVMEEVLPSIRKTGGYVANDDMFIENYLPFADESTKCLFKTTLTTVRKQNELIQKQRTTIDNQANLTESKKEYLNQSDFGSRFNNKIGSKTVGKLLKIVGLAKKSYKKTVPYENYIPRYAQNDFDNNDTARNFDVAYKWNYNNCIKFIDNWLKKHDLYEDFYSITKKNKLQNYIKELYEKEVGDK